MNFVSDRTLEIENFAKYFLLWHPMLESSLEEKISGSKAKNSSDVSVQTCERRLWHTSLHCA
jgi:hypothetical protein